MKSAVSKGCSRSSSVAAFRRNVWRHYREHGRHELPWRRNLSPYSIVISELMLQQTQVERVKGYYQRFLERFPDWSTLAAAPLGEVLKAWVGLGYNRRARFLWELAQAVSTGHCGKLPRTEAELLALPGIGPYTAAAVRAFAFDEQSLMIETNIRAAVISHFFPTATAVQDAKILTVLTKALPRSNFRKWYWALMDYGAFIKKQHPGIGKRSKAHVVQSRFSGSLREMRGRIVRELAIGTGIRKGVLQKACASDSDPRFTVALAKLLAEGMIAEKKGKFFLWS